MLRFLFLLLITLVGAVALGLALESDPGLVRIYFGGEVMEMTLAVFILHGVLLLFALWLLKTIVVLVWTAPARIRAAALKRRQSRARRAMMTGLIHIAEGHWEKGERLLVRHARQAETPLINYLAAARAAQLLGADDRRDIYLKAAYETTPAATKAVLLTQADLQMSHKQYEHALATLKRIQEIAPGHGFALRLLAKAYEALGDWNGVEQLLPRLRKSGAIRPQELERLEKRSLQAAITNARATHVTGSDALDKVWKTTPRRLRRDPELVRDFAEAYMASDQHERAEGLLRDALKSEWNDNLVLLYGDVRSPQVEKQLGRVENWLKNQGESAALLAAAGSLCAAAGLWGKARSYLETSLRLEPNPRTYRRLGELLQELGQPEAAMLAYRQGLEMCPASQQAGQLQKASS